MKARVLYLTISKRKNLSLPLKVETDQFVICLVLPECLSVKFVAFHPRTRIVTALMPSLLFRCFSLYLLHLRTLAQEKRSKIVFVLGLVGRVCLYPLLSRNIIFCPALTMAARAKKSEATDLLTPSLASACTIGILSTLTYTEFDCVTLLAML